MFADSETKAVLVTSTLRRSAIFAFVLFSIWMVTSLVAATQSQDSASGPAWLQDLSEYATVFGVVLASLGTLFGLPATLLHYRKTRAEIRKLELEAASLEGATSPAGEPHASYRVSIKGSDNHVEIAADPRLLAPLLLLLDFILAWVILTLAGYTLSLFVPDLLRRISLGVIAAILLVPIYRETKRVRAVLKPQETEDESAANQGPEEGA